MSEATYLGRVVKVEVGVSAGSHTDITNCKYIRWRTVHNVTPRTIPSQKYPAGWLQSHMWVEGEMALVTKNTVLDTYAPKNADASTPAYFVVTAEDTAKTAKTFTFTGFIISNAELAFSGAGEALYIYKFLAYYVTEG